jgi:hypothetical protein
MSQVPLAARHTVPAGARTSLGQVALEPVHCSATSHAPPDMRQTTVEGENTFVGHVVLDGLHTSATSQPPG